MKVLLIDDPINSLSLLEDKLSESGMECVRTWDAADAKEMCRSDGFDAIIASSLSVLGEAVSFCLAEKKNSDYFSSSAYCYFSCPVLGQSMIYQPFLYSPAQQSSNYS